jgi:hypothetical protein
MKLLVINSVELHVPNQLLVNFAYIRHWGKKWKIHWAVHQLFTNFNKAKGSIWREVLYKILIKFVMPLKPQVLRLITMCLNDAYTKVWRGKQLFD